MQPFYDIVKAKLESNEKVFMYHMPETVMRGVLLLHNLNGARLDDDIPNYKKARFQAIVREVDYQRGYELAKQVMTALTVDRLQEAGVYIHFLNPLHDPVAFPKSAGDFIEFSVNYETVYSEC